MAYVSPEEHIRRFRESRERKEAKEGKAMIAYTQQTAEERRAARAERKERMLADIRAKREARQKRREERERILEQRERRKYEVDHSGLRAEDMTVREWNEWQRREDERYARIAGEHLLSKTEVHERHYLHGREVTGIETLSHDRVSSAQAQAASYDRCR